MAAAALLLLVGCGEEAQLPAAEPYVWDLPEGFPTPRIPEDNPMSAGKVELGRHLFYDVRLSLNETQSCASCHRQDLAFSDGLERSVGSTGELHPRNSMSLTNAAYNPVQTWANPLLDRLEEHVLVPMFGEEPVELGMAGREDVLLERLEEDERYPAWFDQAFPEDEAPISIGNITKALAAFQRTLISGRSAYDRFVYGSESEALSESALRGLDLFFGERLECFHCHGGFNFTANVQHDGTAFREVSFQNTGLYNIDGLGSYPARDTGVYEITLRPSDMGKFRAPTLRNITVTAPYMHDGSMQTIDEVIDHYARGGRLIETGPDAGDGALSPLRSGFVAGFEITSEERADLKAFLQSLTDESFLRDPGLSDPFATD
ncbi:MAG: MbnH family di-heme enzyme [Myxococcota bacterium]